MTPHLNHLRGRRSFISFHPVLHPYTSRTAIPTIPHNLKVTLLLCQSLDIGRFLVATHSLTRILLSGVSMVPRCQACTSLLFVKLCLPFNLYGLVDL
jgi:hypothetical protein